MSHIFTQILTSVPYKVSHITHTACIASRLREFARNMMQAKYHATSREPFHRPRKGYIIMRARGGCGV